MPWIEQIELANSVDDLKTSQSVVGRVYPNLETQDARIATALEVALRQTNSFHGLRVRSGDGHTRVPDLTGVKLHGVMSKVLVRDGTKLFCRSEKCLKISSWQVSSR